MQKPGQQCHWQREAVDAEGERSPHTWISAVDLVKLQAMNLDVKFHQQAQGGYPGQQSAGERDTADRTSRTGRHSGDQRSAGQRHEQWKCQYAHSPEQQAILDGKK